MGRIFQTFLTCDRVYSCVNCKAHLANHDDLVSKAFMGRNGRAYLFRNLSNTIAGEKEDRMLITGLHTVADIKCNICMIPLGWQYLRAYDSAQKYKEGCFIVEKVKINKQPGF